MRPGATRLIVLAVALLALAVPAHAQKDQFFDTLLPLYRALDGTYGDEGPPLVKAVETMTAALTRWDAANREAEAALRAQLRGATPKAALQAHTTLATIAIERSRYADAIREFDEDLRINPAGAAAFHRFKAVMYLALGQQANAADAFRAAWLAEPGDAQNAYRLLVQKSARTTAAQRTQARATLGTLERGLLNGQVARADMPFLSVRPITDDVGGVMAFAPAAYARAFSQLLNGQLESGMTDLRAAVMSDPLVTDGALRREPVVRGIAALRRGDVSAAVAAMQAALAEAPGSSEVHRLLASAEIVNGDVTEGVQHLRDAVRIDPKNERAWMALARALDDTGEWNDAATLLKTAVAALPESGELRWQLSALSGKRQRTDEADLDLIASADRLVLLAGNNELYSRVGRLAQAHLEYDRAIALLEQAAALTPNSARAHQALGRAYADQGREEEGYAELVMALWLNPSDADTLAAIGRLHLTAGRYVAAIDTLSRAVALDATQPQAVHALGEALLRAGRPAEGQPRIEEAERLQARAVEAQRRSRTVGMLSLQAELHLADGKFDDAIAAWREARELDGRNVTIRLGLANTLLAARRLDESAAEFQALLALDPGSDIHRRLAEIYATLGRPEESARERRAYVEERLQELKRRSGL